MKKIKSLALSTAWLIIGFVILFGASIALAVLASIYFSLQGVPAVEMQDRYMEWATKGNGSLLLMVLAYSVFVLVFGLLYYFLIYRKKKGIYSVKEGLCPGNIGIIIAMALAGQGVSMVIMNIINIISPATIKKYSEMVSGIELGKNNPLLIIFTVSIMAPLAEELLFRGMIYSTMRKAFGFWFTLVFSAIVFGAYHMNLVQFIYVIPVGIALGVIYEKTQTIWASMLFHLAFNSFSYVTDIVLSNMPDIFNMIFDILCIPLFIICMIKLKKVNRLAEPSMTVKERTEYEEI